MAARKASLTAATTREPVVKSGVTVYAGNFAFLDASDLGVNLASSPVKVIGVYQQTVVGDGVKRAVVRGGRGAGAYIMDNKAGDLVTNVSTAFVSTDTEAKKTDAGSDLALSVHAVRSEGVEVVFA